MFKYKETDLIENTDLSIRSKNSLQKEGIITIKNLLAYDANRLKLFKNLGVKSINEILKLISLFNEVDIDEILQKENTNKSNNNIITFQRNNLIYKDCYVKELNLSVRLKNSLQKENFFLLSQLIDLNEESIKKIKNLGENSILEFLEFKKSISFEEIDKIQEEFSAEFIFFIKNLEVEFKNIFKFNRKIINEIKLIYDNIEKENPNKKKILLEKVLKINLIKESIKEEILRNLGAHFTGCNIDTLLNTFSRNIITASYRDDLIIELLESRKILIDEDIYSLKRLNLLDVLDNLKLKDEYKFVFRERLKGCTLEEVAKKFSKTRERIRQLEVKVLSSLKNLVVEEDKYSYIYTNYNINNEDFNFAFNEPIETYQYLKLKYKIRQEKDIEQILEDENISNKFKKKIQKIIDKSYIYINEEKIKDNKNNIIMYLCKTYASEKPINFNNFLKLYNSMLEDVGKNNESKYQIQDRGNQLSASRYILKNKDNGFRYYDIDSKIYIKLIEELNLNQYNNIDMSTLKLFKLYPELMNEYEIQDEYELHNLLKKIISKNSISDLEFSRMPTLKFGNSNREIQILDLLIKLSPISSKDFGKAYEDEYGVKSETVLWNYMDNFSEYLQEGIYNVNLEAVPNNKLVKIKEVLTKDFYLLSEAKNIIKNNMIEFKDSFVNNYLFNNLGYKLYSSYVISTRFYSASDYFKYILTKDDIITINNPYKNIIAYSHELQKLKNSYDLIEFSQGKCINIRKLEALGYSLNKIYDFRNNVINFIDEDTIFTFTYLQNKNFYHELEELGFDEYFYAEILSKYKEELSSLKKYGNIILKKGKHPIKVLDLIELIIYSKEELYIDIYDLIDILENKYGLKIKKQNIYDEIKDTRLHYSPITEMLYGDYDIYYEEIGL